MHESNRTTTTTTTTTTKKKHRGVHGQQEPIKSTYVKNNTYQLVLRTLTSAPFFAWPSGEALVSRNGLQLERAQK